MESSSEPIPASLPFDGKMQPPPSAESKYENVKERGEQATTNRENSADESSHSALEPARHLSMADAAADPNSTASHDAATETSSIHPESPPSSLTALPSLSSSLNPTQPSPTTPASSTAAATSALAAAAALTAAPISRPSSLSSKSRYSLVNAMTATSAGESSNRAESVGSNRPHHAYFASSEEESEAELDEKDSHSSAPRPPLFYYDRPSKSIHHGSHHLTSMHPPSSSGIGALKQKSTPASRRSGRSVGSKKLTEIASKVSNCSTKKAVCLTGASTHLCEGTSNMGNARQSLVRMSGAVMKDDGIRKHVGITKQPTSIISKKKAIVSSSSGCNNNNNSPKNSLNTPCPPQTVTVAVGGNTSNPNDSTTVSSSCVNFDPSNPVSSCSGNAAPASSLPSSTASFRRRRCRKHRHLPSGLPVLKDPRSCMWTSTHDANAPSEDRYSSLVNVLLRPPKTSMRMEKKSGNASPTNNNSNMNNNNSGSRSGSSCEGSIFDGGEEETTVAHVAHPEEQPNIPGEDDEDNTSLIRLSLWSVIDGHGGGCVATYAAEVLLPHIAASVARALNSEIVDRGVCNVNGQFRDANALDLDGLIRSSDRSRFVGKNQARQREAGIDVVNPNSIHYRSPYEDSESEGDVGVDHNSRGTTSFGGASMAGSSILRSESESEAESEAPVSVASSLLPGNPIIHGESVSSVKTSVKTAVSPVMQHAPVGTHSPAEVAAITRAITDSFLAVDEGWINSIDPVTTHQTSCVSNGRWNAGACALVVFIVQRLDWCKLSRVDHEIHHRERGARGFEDTSHNKDAARRRKLDYATKSKSVSSLSTLSSTSSITTEANTTEMLVEESEITETEDDDDVSDIFGPRRRRRKKTGINDPHHDEGVFIPTPSGCKCHYYRPHDAMLYTAHVGDCRAVMLGSAPPRTIKVPPEGDSSHSLGHADMSEDESSSSVSIADEISSSDHDSDSSEEGCEDDEHFIRRGTPPSGNAGNAAYMGYVPAKRQRRGENSGMIEQPFVPLPPINRRESFSSEESAVESDDSASTTAQEHQPPVSAIRSRVRTRVDIPYNKLDDEKMMVRSGLETEDEEAEDEIKEEIRSVRSGSPTQMDRPPSPTQLVADPPDHPPPLPLSMLMRPIDLTTDHSAYNPAEVTAVLRRCNNAPKAISSASGGGIKRVAGSLAVTRALGDAYLKTPRLSFFPYKRHAPYITARPEVNCRIITKSADRILILASDGVWERASGDDVLRWVRNYYNARIAGVKESTFHPLYDVDISEGAEHSFGESAKRISRRKVSGSSDGISSVKTDVVMKKEPSLLTSPPDDNSTATDTPPNVSLAQTEDCKEDEGTASESTSATITTADETAKVGSKRKHLGSGSISTRSSNGSLALEGRGTRKGRHHSSRSYALGFPTVSDVIVRKVLNKVRKTRNISSLRMLMSLPKGRARRSKHDDITASVVDLSGFVS
ncbi:hypothetical protein HJC23_011994 [Cyclotella cryptica]|uniref:PPM-type phosphatase domain-containing protein n=1 Tax=Cyclotella cryptica TaxID=29204 RepID=A0ABD3QR21_9STRA|eukprot:CCRYP_003050-RB/>CCRYP_003050-RB protein AED:0.01 eAED:0.01 QI:114/1/1/1/1/1/3/441/1454